MPNSRAFSFGRRQRSHPAPCPLATLSSNDSGTPAATQNAATCHRLPLHLPSSSIPHGVLMGSCCPLLAYQHHVALVPPHAYSTIHQCGCTLAFTAPVARSPICPQGRCPLLKLSHSLSYCIFYLCLIARNCVLPRSILLHGTRTPYAVSRPSIPQQLSATPMYAPSPPRASHALPCSHAMRLLMALCLAP